MSERDRLKLLSYYGLTAWQGLKAAAAGIDLVIDPDERQEQAGAADAPALSAPPLPQPPGSAIGRRAMSAAGHRPPGATLAPAGTAVPETDLLAEVPFKLALYPGSGAALAEQALGVTGRLLTADGDPDVEATAHDLAWLPLKTGRQVFSRVASGRLVAVGGYRRAGLVRFGSAASRFAGTWSALGEDALAEWVPPELRQPLVQEEPGKLLAAAEQQQVQTALLGGAALDSALRLPGASLAAEFPPVPGLGIIPVWGLYSSGRVPPMAPVERTGAALVPVDETTLPQELKWAVVQ